MTNVLISLGGILIFCLMSYNFYYWGYKHGYRSSYDDVSQNGFNSNNIPWRVNIPTVDHNKNKVHIHVFPVALNTNEFVINIQSDDNERVVGAVVRSPE